MDEDSYKEKPTGSMYSRHRNPTFSKEEIKILLTLVKKYKTIILNKSTSASANHAKDAAWSKIEILFNKHNLQYERSADSLKMKWDNLKKEARRLSKNLLDINYYEFDDVTGQVVALICESESNTGIIEKSEDADVDLNDLEGEKVMNESHKKIDDDNDKDSDDNDADSVKNSKFLNRSMNFSPDECRLLVQCVKQEKKHVMSKGNTVFVNKLKNRAWYRITNSYNRLSPQKRSTKVLRTKFNNMKKMARNLKIKDYFKDVAKKSERPDEEPCKKIKAEPVFEYKVSFEPPNEVHDDQNDIQDDDDKSNNFDMNFVPDPLSTVLNSDSGIESINPPDNKEVVKLKMELLNYKMETAKLERKRVEDAIRAEELESSLRLRAARLEAVAAAMKLPPSDLALQYTAAEASAQQYLDQHHQT